MINERTLNNFDFEAGEVININKPKGWTSFDVVNKIRRHFKIKKVGHAGTLDPFATGVLLILTGKSTKKAKDFLALDKQYLAEIELGKVTDTLDIEGRVINQQPVKHFSEIEIAAVCEEFVGESEQIPPLFSAIKYRGKKLYQLARRGEMVQPQPRKITIYELRLVEVNLPKIVVEVTCSKGTYIRALARDIGEKLGVGGYLRSLIRTRVGTFHISESLNLTEFLTLKQA